MKEVEASLQDLLQGKLDQWLDLEAKPGLGAPGLPSTVAKIQRARLFLVLHVRSASDLDERCYTNTATRPAYAAVLQV